MDECEQSPGGTTLQGVVAGQLSSRPITDDTLLRALQQCYEQALPAYKLVLQNISLNVALGRFALIPLGYNLDSIPEGGTKFTGRVQPP